MPVSSSAISRARAPLATSLATPRPERQRLGQRQRMHEAHGGPALDAIDQHPRERLRLSIRHGGQAPDGIGTAHLTLPGWHHDHHGIARDLSGAIVEGKWGRSSTKAKQSPGAELVALVADPRRRWRPRAPRPADAPARPARRCRTPRGRPAGNSTLHDPDRRGEAARRHVAPDIARRGIAPLLLIGAARDGLGARNRRLEQARQRHAQPGRQPLQQQPPWDLLSPRSISEIIERLTPLRSASASSDSARNARRSRTRSAMRMLRSR